MNKKLLTVLLLGICLVGKAQYNNECIDYNKTYYKFHVGGNNGLHQITQSVLNTAGLGSVPAEQFQLWKNGVEIPIFTSVPSGIMGTGDYIEFYGQLNDGKTDARLSRDPSLHLSDRWSLLSDSSTYFLTVNSAGGNKRLVNNVNNVAANVLAPEPYFIHTMFGNTKTRINAGVAAVIGEYVYSSSYDIGEGWASRDVRNNTPIVENLNNLFVSPAGPDVIFDVAASGNAQNSRKVEVKINGNSILLKTMDLFSGFSQKVNFPLSYIGKATDTIRISNITANANDRMVVAKYEMTYPRLFNFGGNSVFEFSLPASASGNYLEISNFANSAREPVLYDLTTGFRYLGNIAVAGKIRFALPAGGDRKFVLCSTAPALVKSVLNLESRTFVNYSDVSNQADFLIISNKLLYNGPNGNPVEAYRQYRSTAEGGAFNAKVYDIDQLIDQFAYGIKKHPLSVKNFISFAHNKFSISPKFIFIIGRGLTYDQYRVNQLRPITENINLVPTFGSPASDNILASEGYDPIPETPIGRLSAIFPYEVESYLKKIKEHDQALKNGSQTFADKGWIKNVVHAIGGSDPYLQSVIFGYMNAAAKVLEDTSFGGKVYSFSKNAAFAVQQLTSEQLKDLFSEGINILTYFGHSSANTLEFNLDDPNVYSNQGKYPLFIVNGCNAGNFFVYDTLRYSANALTLSEKYVLANQRGSIGFLASTHYGIVAYLNIYTYGMYEAIAGDYNLSIGELQIKAGNKLMSTTGFGDFFGRLHAEEILLHGDPSVKLYPQPAPDYLIEDQFIKFNPPFISVADNTFDVDLGMFNIGKAVSDSIMIDVKRQLPNGTMVQLYRQKIPGIKYSDSLRLTLPINPLTDKGENKLIVNIDAEDAVTEISESNNTITKSFYIIEEEARPVSPYNLSIVGKNNITFYASAANPFSPVRNYVMEIDTSELFNSAWKKSQTISAPGGLLQFNVAGLSFSDSTVYYWRTAPVPTTGNSFVWNTSSFIYITGAGEGYNQSHYFQQKKSDLLDLKLNDDRTYRYGELPARLTLKTGLFPYYEAFEIGVTMNTDIYTTYGCKYSSLQIFVYDSLTLEPWKNTLQPNGFGRFGSVAPCTHNKLCFEFPYDDTSYRRKAIQFLESIPKGYFVSITNLGNTANKAFVKDWLNDTTRLGSGVSLYHTLKKLGFADIDRFTHNVPFLFFNKKGDPSYPIYSQIGNKESDFLDAGFDLTIRNNVGQVSSPWLGPALKWNRFKASGFSREAEPDSVGYALYGRDYAGNESFIIDLHTTTDTTLDFVDARSYPYLKLVMRNRDTIHGTPHQLRYWRLFGELPPEGALASNLVLNAKDTLDVGEPFNFQVAFKNISDTKFDSLLVHLTITDKDNVQRKIILPRTKPLVSNDTIVVSYQIDTKDYRENNTLFLNINPDQDQPEQYLFNNFLFKNFYVRPDNYNPTLDVTFDGVHILNRDIVSSKPKIIVKLKDNSKFLALNDTALMQVKVKFPNGDLRAFRFDNDTLRFNPADLTGGNTDNTATIDFAPYFPEDGEYELIVSGKDRSDNSAGVIEYRVVFSVINKAMISNLLNYPNPFTTSTAFVFTVTGSEVPQNIRIQILTITGKIVREITKEELGPIHIGRNITEFKWDGTDQYGQKLANGVYLYRVITNLNGKKLDKYKAEGDKTDQYFKAGYGKMYLMR